MSYLEYSLWSLTFLQKFSWRIQELQPIRLKFSLRPNFVAVQQRIKKLSKTEGINYYVYIYIYIYIINIIIILRVFNISVCRWFFHCGLSDSKSLQVSRTLLSILADLENCLVFVWSPLNPFISNSSILFINSLLTVPSSPIAINICITFMFYSFLSSQARSRYSSFFSFSFSFAMWSARTAKPTIQQVLFLFVDYH